MEISKNNKIVFPKNCSFEKNDPKFAKISSQSFSLMDEEDMIAASRAAYAAGVAAVLMQQNCPKDIENEIYNEMLNENYSDNEDSDKLKSVLNTIKEQFSFEEGAELMNLKENISNYPEIFNSIVSAKNENDGTRRFNGFECAEIFDYADTINNNPKAFSTVFNAKNLDDSPQYNSSEICKFMEVAEKIEKYPKIFKLISDFSDSEGNQLFCADECVKLMENAGLIKEYQDLFIENVEKQADENGEVNILKTINLLKQKSLEEPTKAPTTTELEKKKALEKIQKTDVYKQIDEVSQQDDDTIIVYGKKIKASDLKNNIINRPKLFYMLAEMLNDYDMSPRFNDKELILLADRLSFVRGCKSNFFEIANCKNQDGKNAFNAQECLRLTTKHSYVVENVKYLLSVKDPETGKQRFKSKDICPSLYVWSDWGNAKPNIETFEKLAMTKDKNTGKYRFGIDSAKYLCQRIDKIEKYPQVFEKLISLKDGNSYRFDESDISNLLGYADLIEKYPEQFDEIVNKTDDKGKKLSGYHCGKMLKNCVE